MSAPAWQVERAALAIDCPRHGVPVGTWCPIAVIATGGSEPGVVCVPRRKAAAAVRVTVCDSCLTESCWQGVLMCEDAHKAGTVTVLAPDAQARSRTSPPAPVTSDTPGITGDPKENEQR